ncbi:lipid II:glycine glycyltransferase FemX [Sulfurisoma sediminicola]|uniref:Acetyltransferase (GNAT) family protein n=1 Tax=Sulfurisoma sediminicola TaxID=1381557 RepID=A0A497XL25_9PROT|nr:GNAT family N-acetyltransferase [Sulfurisoma sediminicola]RLJ68005.1 acetyltransferase (GNAT) family protein [Sulfurisoma sediminicola]
MTRSTGDDIEFLPLDASLEADWDALVRDSDDGWPFALAGWQRMILAVEPWGLTDHSFGLAQRGKLLAVMPLQFSSAGQVLASSGWGGSGPIVAAGQTAKHRRRVLQAVLGRAEKVGSDLGAKRLDFWLSPVTRSSIQAPWGVNPFVFFGYTDVSSVAQVIDLAQDTETLRRGIAETARQAIRKAEAAGCVVEEAAWPEMVDTYYRIHVETYTRTGTTPHPRAYFEGIARELWPRRHSVLWVARDGRGEPIAFHNALWFRDGAFYHTGCSTAEGLATGANYLLFWRALLAARESGIRWYDCGAISAGESSGKLGGLSVFKTRFGGEPHRFFNCSKVLEAPAAVVGKTGRRARIGGRFAAWLGRE